MSDQKPLLTQQTKREFLMTVFAGLGLLSTRISFMLPFKPSYQSAVSKLSPGDYAVVEIQILNARLRQAQQGETNADWGDFKRINEINDSMLASGELVEIKNESDEFAARWRYKFSSLAAREKWSNRLSEGRTVSVRTNSIFSVRTDASGRRYLHETSFGWA